MVEIPFPKYPSLNSWGEVKYSITPSKEIADNPNNIRTHKEDESTYSQWYKDGIENIHRCDQRMRLKRWRIMTKPRIREISRRVRVAFLTGCEQILAYHMAACGINFCYIMHPMTVITHGLIRRDIRVILLEKFHSRTMKIGQIGFQNIGTDPVFFH